MGLLSNLFNIGGNDNEIITELTGKVAELEAVVEKSALNNSLSGIVGSNFLTLGVNNSDKAYNENYTVFRGINLLSDMIAQLPLKIYRGEQELPPDFIFPNGFSMNRPNPGMSLNELLYITCVYYFFRGEFINHIIDDGIFRLVPINPKNIQRNQNGTWRLDNNITLQQEELIYTALFDPTVITSRFNSTNNRGLSPIDVIKAEVAADSSAGKYITRFFQMYGQPGGTLVDKMGNIDGDKMDKLVAQFNASHAGEDRAYDTVGLPKGIEYQEVSQTMREMQFLDSRKDIRDKILSVLGIHKALFGVTDQVNRSVAEEATRQLWVQTLKPKAVRIQEKWNQQLFNPHFPGYHCKFDFSEVSELQENMESLVKQAGAFVKLGYTLNEVNTRFNLGMEEITAPEGDQRYVPRIMTTLDQIVAQTPPTEPVKPQKDVLEALDKIMNEEKTNGDDYRQSYLRKRKPLETKFNSKMKTYFFKQRKEVLSIINNAKHSHNITNNLSVFFGEENQRLKETTKPLYVEGAELGIKIADAQFKIVSNSIDKDIVEPIIGVDEDIIISRLNKIVNVNHTVHNQIKMQMFDSLRAGETTKQLSKRIKDVYNFTEKRATTIARTEVSGVVNDSTAKEYEKKGVKRITWAGGTRPSHAKVNGSTVEFGKLFANQLRWPGDTGSPGSTPANLINCRCTFYANLENE